MQIEISSEIDILDLVVLLKEELAEHGARCVTIGNLDNKPSERMRRLYWSWIGAISKHHEENRDRVHRLYKEKFLLGIYIANREHHTDLYDLVAHMKSVREESPDHYQYIREFVINRVSHKEATNSDMVEYLRKIEADAIGDGVILPYPPEAQSLLDRE